MDVSEEEEEGLKSLGHVPILRLSLVVIKLRKKGLSDVHGLEARWFGPSDDPSRTDESVGVPSDEPVADPPHNALVDAIQ